MGNLLDTTGPVGLTALDRDAILSGLNHEVDSQIEVLGEVAATGEYSLLLEMLERFEATVQLHCRLASAFGVLNGQEVENG